MEIDLTDLSSQHIDDQYTLTIPEKSTTVSILSLCRRIGKHRKLLGFSVLGGNLN